MRVSTKQPWGHPGATLVRVLLQLSVHISRHSIVLLSTVSNIGEAVALPASKVNVEKLTADTKAAVVIVLLSPLFTPPLPLFIAAPSHSPAIPVMETSALKSLAFFPSYFAHLLLARCYVKAFREAHSEKY